MGAAWGKAGVVWRAAVAIGLLALPVATASAARADGTMGTLTVTGTSTDGCLHDFSCVTFSLTCAAPHDDIAPLTGRIEIGAPAATRRGTLVLFGGGGGEDYFATNPSRARLVRQFRTAGFETLEIAWDGPWGLGTQGLAALSCRPAAAVEWAVDRDAAAGSTPPLGKGVCGVCVVGNSIGSTQAASSVSFSTIGDAVDAVVPISGPTIADITAGCRRDGTPLQYEEPADNPARSRVDDSLDGGDPAVGGCSQDPADLSMAPVWDANSLAIAGRATFPTTRFSFVWGKRDITGAAGQGLTYLAALFGGGSPMLGYACLSAGHGVLDTPAGLAAVSSAVFWRPPDGSDVPPVPPPTLSPRCPPTP